MKTQAPVYLLFPKCYYTLGKKRSQLNKMTYFAKCLPYFRDTETQIEFSLWLFSGCGQNYAKKPAWKVFFEKLVFISRNNDWKIRTGAIHVSNYFFLNCVPQMTYSYVFDCFSNLASLQDTDVKIKTVYLTSIANI